MKIISVKNDLQEMQMYMKQQHSVNMDYFWFLATLVQAINEKNARIKVSYVFGDPKFEQIAKLNEVVIAEHKMGVSLHLDLTIVESNERVSFELPNMQPKSIIEYSHGTSELRKYSGEFKNWFDINLGNASNILMNEQRSDELRNKIVHEDYTNTSKHRFVFTNLNQ